MRVARVDLVSAGSTEVWPMNTLGRLALLLIAAALAGAQTYLPDYVVSAGGGFAYPSSKFAYGSISKLVGQGTYVTVAQQYRLLAGGRVIGCTLAGPTKPTNQALRVVVGITGLGGGCDSSGAAWSAQAFLDWHFTKAGTWGLTITGMLNEDHGYKVTLAPRIAIFNRK